jgi:hypothetical protein
MFRFHILGLCLCKQGKNSTDVLMLNSGYPRVTPAPHHLQTLFAPRQYVRSYSLPRLASVSGRFRDEWEDSVWLGWDLGGKTGELLGEGAPAYEVALPANPTHPDPAAMDWSSLHWVFDMARAIPADGLVLRDEFRRIGKHTSAMIRFRGGRIAGGEPFSDGSNAIWKVSSTYRQAFTDTVDVIYDDGPPVIEFFDADNQPVGEVVMEANGEAWLINEAPERSLQLKVAAGGPAAAAAKAECRDMPLYLEAFAPEQLTAGVKVVFDGVFVGGAIFSGDYCSAIRYRED